MLHCLLKPGQPGLKIELTESMESSLPMESVFLFGDRFGLSGVDSLLLLNAFRLL